MSVEKWFCFQWEKVYQIHKTLEYLCKKEKKKKTKANVEKRKIIDRQQPANTKPISFYGESFHFMPSDGEIRLILVLAMVK